GTDKLDGDAEDGDVAILFDKIKSIERHLSRSRVVLKSGRELELHGSNDVNSENRGIIVTDETGTMVDIPWEEFQKVTFTAVPAKPIARYNDFQLPKEITATVTTVYNKTLKGRTVLDLDEEFDFELFQGKEGDIEYHIPVRNIQKISVIHGHKAELFLKNGKKLSLDESQDV